MARIKETYWKVRPVADSAHLPGDRRLIPTDLLNPRAL